MIRLFASLKLRLLRNILRTRAGVPFVIFTLMIGIISFSLTVAALRGPLPPIGLLPILGAALLVGWTFGPLLFGSSDETIDTTRLALLPLRARDLAPGMVVANLIGPGPLAILAPMLGLAARLDGTVARFAGVSLALATAALSSVASRWVQTAFGSAMRKRNRRDLILVFTGLFAGVLGIGAQILLVLGVSSERIAAIGRVAQWLPGGWSGWAFQQLLSGSGTLAALAVAAVTAMLATAIAFRWVESLERALSEVTEASVDSMAADHFMSDARPLDRIARRLGRYGPVLAKEVRYLRRHPRYRVQVLSQFMVLIIGGAPFLAAALDRNPTSVLLGCIPALTAGITSSNLLGADGRALWSEVLSIDSMLVILRGRALAFFALGIGSSLIVIFVTAVWTGGWRFVPAALGASLGMGLAGSGTGAFTSTLAPMLLPDETNPNPFATGDTGSGCVSAIVTFLGAIAGLTLSAPILAMLAFARTEIWAQVVLVTAVPLYGFAVFTIATRFAGRRSDRRIPDLVTALS